jgi:hypothetical protein
MPFVISGRARPATGKATSESCRCGVARGALTIALVHEHALACTNAAMAVVLLDRTAVFKPDQDARPSAGESGCRPRPLTGLALPMSDGCPRPAGR